MFKNIPLIFTHIPKTGGMSIHKWATQQELLRFYHPPGKKHSTTEEDILEWRDFVLTPNDIKSFAVVRNPFDRLVSGWKYYTDKGKCDFETLEDFVFAESNGLQNSVIRNTMCSFINEDTMILRYENLVEDFKIIQNMFDRHASLRWVNGSNREEGYRQYYNEKTKEHVSQLYAEDLHRFNYKF